MKTIVSISLLLLVTIIFIAFAYIAFSPTACVSCGSRHNDPFCKTCEKRLHQAYQETIRVRAEEVTK